MRSLGDYAPGRSVNRLKEKEVSLHLSRTAHSITPATMSARAGWPWNSHHRGDEDPLHRMYRNGRNNFFLTRKREKRKKKNGRVSATNHRALPGVMNSEGEEVCLIRLFLLSMRVWPSREQREIAQLDKIWRFFFPVDLSYAVVRRCSCRYAHNSDTHSFSR